MGRRSRRRAAVFALSRVRFAGIGGDFGVDLVSGFGSFVMPHILSPVRQEGLIGKGF